MKLASESINFAKERRPFSPPLKSPMRLNTSSPVNIKAANTFLIFVFVRLG